MEKYDEAIELLLAELKKQDEKGFITEFDYEINGFQQLLVGIIHLSASILGMPVNPNNSIPLNWNKELWEELLKYPSERELIIIASFAIKEWKRLNVIKGFKEWKRLKALVIQPKPENKASEGETNG